MGKFGYFPKSDRRAFLFLLCIGAILLLLFFGISSKTENSYFNNNGNTGIQQNRGYHKYYDRRTHKYVYDEGHIYADRFNFDPNTADSIQLLRLGLAPWTVRSIYRFRAKGGTFRTPSDFARVPNITLKQYKELKPYIHISSDYEPAYKSVARKSPYDKDSLHHTIKIGLGQSISLNTADTTMLCHVPGIGHYFATKIVYYRESLGGFYSTDQLREIEDFPASAIPYFNIQTEHIHKMKINSLTRNQLDRHPYINYYQARAITDYRRLKGPIKSIDDLKLLPDFTPHDITRLEPYLNFDN